MSSPKRAAAHLSLETLWDHHRKKTRVSDEAMQHLSKCTDCLWALGVCQISATLEEARRSYSKLSRNSEGQR